MGAKAPRDLLACLSTLGDPRMDRTREHRLDDILAIAIPAVICGAAPGIGPTHMADFGRVKRDWLKTFLHLPKGIPSHDTVGRVLGRLGPDAFEACFQRWVRGLATNQLKQETRTGLSLPRKRLRAAWDQDYLMKVLGMNILTRWACSWLVGFTSPAESIPCGVQS